MECGVKTDLPLRRGWGLTAMFGLASRNNIDLIESGMDDRTPLNDLRYVVMDTELTGLDHRKDSIVSLGAVVMAGPRILMGETFYREVSPETELTSESVVVHGITPSDVRDKPGIESALGDFLDFCEGAVVVGHFLSLDLRFLNRELKRLFNRPLQRPAVDTLQLHEWMQEHDGDFSRHYSGMARDKDLFSLAKKYQIPVSAAHNALMDAFITAQLFQRFLSFLPALGVRNLKELLRVGKP